LAALKIGQA